LKVQQVISYTLTASKLEARFVSGYDPNASAEEFAFTGTKQSSLKRENHSRHAKPTYRAA